LEAALVLFAGAGMYRQVAFRALMLAGVLVLVSLFLMGLALTEDSPDAISLNGFVKVVTHENPRTGEKHRVVQRHASGMVYERVEQTTYARGTPEGAIVNVTVEYVRPTVTVTQLAPVDRWMGLFGATVILFLVALVLYIHLDYDNYLLARQSGKAVCPRCGYDWRATSRRHCPECGLGHEMDPLITLMRTEKNQVAQ
jgi:hypothetical protein